MDWIVAHGGPVGVGVLFAKYLLVLFSVVSVAVMIERALTLRRIRQVEETEYRALRELLIEAAPHSAPAARDAAMASVRSRVQAGQAPSSAALKAGFSHVGASQQTMRDAIELELSSQEAALSHNLSILGTIASTAPYIGLFGTVLGILSAFDKIAQSGQTGAKVVAAPIAEALTATAIGLGVAIPAVMAYNYFSGRANDLALRVENHALDLAARLPDERLDSSAQAVSSGAMSTHANGIRPNAPVTQASKEGGESVAIR